jgi:hypothetical protein
MSSQHRAKQTNTGAINMIIDKNNEGAWRIAESVNGYLETKVYYFSNKKDAVRNFKQFIKELKQPKKQEQ